MNTLVLGGTGFLGSIIKSKYPTFIFWGRKEYTVETSNNEDLIDFIKQNNITHIIDFTKNKKHHILPFVNFIRKLPNDVIYVNISTYGVMFNNMFLYEEEYYSTKKIVEKSIRPQDYNIRVPMVLESDDKLVIFNGVCTEYMYTLNPNEFLFHLMNILNYEPGTYVMPSRVVYK